MHCDTAASWIGWIAFISFTFILDVSCGLPNETFCVNHNRDNTFSTGKKTCPQGDGMLIMRIAWLSDSECGDDDGHVIASQDILLTDNIQILDLHLKKACNGRSECYFEYTRQLPRVRINHVDVNSYLLEYKCLPAIEKHEGRVLNVMEDVELQKSRGKYILIIKSEDFFSRQCFIQSIKESVIFFRLLWITMSDNTDLTFNACLRLFEGESKVYNYGCPAYTNPPPTSHDLPVTPAIRTFKNRTDFQVQGQEAFVWIEISVSEPYVIRCQTLTQDYHNHRTEILPPKWTGTTPTTTHPITSPIQTTGNPDPYTASHNVTLTIKETQESDDHKLHLIVVLTSTLAAIATCVALALIIYIFFIRKNSTFQRKRSVKRLERAVDRPQPPHQPPHRRQQRPQSTPQSEPTYAEYTYIDGQDLDKNKQDQLPPNNAIQTGLSSPYSLPRCEDIVAYGIDSHYSDNYTFVEAEFTPGEYNHLGLDLKAKAKEGCAMYDTASSTEGRYEHFDDVITTASKKTIGNYYDG